MIKILLHTVLRSLSRQKAYSLINIFGLATGVSCALLILIWIEYETSFDTFHQNIDRIYSVYENQKYADGDIFSVYSTPSPLAESLKREFPEIKNASRMVSTWGQLTVNVGGKNFIENGGKIVDPDFFKIFSFKNIVGDSNDYFSNQNSVVLSQKIARKYFGDSNPLGRTIEINSKYKFKVSAVIQNTPKNSSINYDFLLPVKFFQDFWNYDLNDWEANSFHTFIKLRKSANKENVRSKLKNFLARHVINTNVDLDIQTFKDYHLHSINKGNAGPIWYVRVFFIVAVIILLIACFNYMNLATARSERRSKEVAIRKVVGAQRNGLIGLFLGESLLFTIIALGISIVLVELLLPGFGELINRDLHLNPVDHKFFIVTILVVLITGIVSGSYPAIYLSSFAPIQIIRGFFKHDSALVRKILVVIQITMSVTLFISTGIIYQQLEFLKRSDIGYNKDNIVYVEMGSNFNHYYKQLRNELVKIPGVHWVTAANQMPVNFTNSTWDVDWSEKSRNAEDILFQLSFVDFDFIEAFEMDVIQGRAFSKEYGEDTLQFIINESAASKMNMENAIGEELTIWGKKGHVIGVVKDFNFNSLKVGVEPLIIMRNPSAFKYIGIRVGEEHQPVILDQIRKTWHKIIPEIPFTYRKLTEDFDYFYQAESRMSKLFLSFTIIAFIISCLGLFGLASFITERKAREIAVRKVFGANVDQVFYLLLKDFLKWMMIAIVAAWGMAFFAMEWWLNGFAYRIHIGIGIFIVSAILTFLIAFLTIYKLILSLSGIAPISMLKYE